MRRRAVVWLVVLGAWTLLAVVFSVSSSLTYVLTYQPPQWGRTFALALSEWYPWAALTPIVVWLAGRLMPGGNAERRTLNSEVASVQPSAFKGQRGNAERRMLNAEVASVQRAAFRVQRFKYALRALTLAALGLPIAFVKVTLTRVLRDAAGDVEYFQLSSLATQYLIYWGIVAIAHVAAYYRAERERELRASRAETRLAEARLQLLRMQIHPHFLFNTLNTIAELIHEHPPAAERMIGSLAQLLRETLDAGGIDRVPLAREVELLDRYVDIQRTRFGDRLDVRVQVDPAARSGLVPIFVLQPLVENAILHGLSARVRAGRIDVTAVREGNRLAIAVQDDGVGLRGGELRPGVGLGNTRARLIELYGSDHRFEVANAEGAGTVVRLSIPWQT